MLADFSDLDFGSGEELFLQHSKHLRVIFSPSETWLTKGMCSILVFKHPTKLLIILSIN